MEQLGRDIRGHPVASAVFAVAWVAVWIVTVVSWRKDADGYSIGMNTIVIPLHLLLPLVLGGLIGWWRQSAGRPFDWACALTGLAFGVIHFAVLMLVDAAWLPSVADGQTTMDFAAEAVGFAIGYAVIAAGLSFVGGRAYVALFSRS